MAVPPAEDINHVLLPLRTQFDVVAERVVDLRAYGIRFLRATLAHGQVMHSAENVVAGPQINCIPAKLDEDVALCSLAVSVREA